MSIHRIRGNGGDNRYVTVSGTDIMPDMMLGRLAVNSATEAEAVVAKIIAYDDHTPGWRLAPTGAGSDG